MERKELFFSLLNNEFSKDGFKYVKSKKKFVKREKGNDFTIEYETWLYFFAIKTHYHIFLREIEKIKKNAWGKLYHKIETIGDTKQYIQKTDTEEKVIEVTKKEILFYHSFLKEYFNKYSNYKYLDEMLNKIPGKELQIAYNPIFTIFLAIIVAELTDNPKIEELFAFYRDLIVNVKKNKLMGIKQEYLIEEIKKYDLLVEYLKKMKI